ncbi:MAG: alpha/beta fold hydrolase [Massilia sp.]
MKSSLCLKLPLAALLLFSGAAACAASLGNSGKVCHLPGSTDALRCVKVPVALDYRRPAGATLPLHVTVAPAFRESARPDPLFVLAGGPGQAGTDVLPALNLIFRKARATRDIVFIDQRGTGLSGKLDCASAPDDEHFSDAQADAAVKACIATLKQPLTAYNTLNAARDIEQVRLALGYRKINLWGGSYGTRLAQTYARIYPANLRAMVLDGVVAPDQVVPAGGRDAQAALDALMAHCAADAPCKKAYPNLRAEFTGIIGQLAHADLPLTLPDPRTAASLSLAMTSDRFIGTVHNILYSQLDSRRLPFLIHSASQGRWEPFIARRNASGDFAADGATSIILHLAVVCAEDYPRLTAQLLADDTAGSFLGAAQVQRLASLCKATAVTPVALAAPSRIDTPALLLSGALDPVTPPRRAQAAGKFMPRAQQLVVKNAGHGVSQLGCAPRLIREFLDRPEAPVAADCLKEIPAPTFQLGSAGPQP